MKRFCKWCLKVKIMNHRDRQYRNILGVRLRRVAARSDATVEMRMVIASWRETILTKLGIAA